LVNILPQQREIMPTQRLSSSRQIARRGGGGPRHQGSQRQRQRQRQRTGAYPRRRRIVRERERPPQYAFDTDVDVDLLDLRFPGGEGTRQEAVVDALLGHNINITSITTSTRDSSSISGSVGDSDRLLFHAYRIGDDETTSSRGDDDFEDVNLDSESSSRGDEESEEEFENDSNIDPSRNQFAALVGEGSDSENEDDMESVELSESEREDSESSITSSEEHAFEGGESESQSDGDDDGDVARCAICFLKDDQNHNWRRLMHLPCCGGNGKEATSTMRFCAACLLQLSRDAIVKETYDDMRRPEPNSIFPSNNYLVHTDQNRQSPMPERRFYQHDCQAHERRFIDCPRCKDILIVDMKKIARSHQACDYENGDWTNPKNADSISLRRPTFKGRCQYAAEVESTARIVFTVAMLNANLLPIEVLKSTEDDISRMLRWRILHRVPGEENGDVFMMKKEEHLKLIQFLNMDRWTHTDASFRKEVYDNLRIVLLDGMSAAFVNHLKTFRLVTALRLISRLLTTVSPPGSCL